MRVAVVLVFNIESGGPNLMLPKFVSLEEHDRRSRPRLALTYPVRISRPGESRPVETRTEDLSCEGFYCLSERPFSPHEWLECELVIPGDPFGYPSDRDLVLSCMAEVVRVVPQAAGETFGIACRMGNYSLSRKVPERRLELVAQ